MGLIYYCDNDAHTELGVMRGLVLSVM